MRTLILVYFLAIASTTAIANGLKPIEYELMIRTTAGLTAGASIRIGPFKDIDSCFEFASNQATKQPNAQMACQDPDNPTLLPTAPRAMTEDPQVRAAIFLHILMLTEESRLKRERVKKLAAAGRDPAKEDLRSLPYDPARVSEIMNMVRTLSGPILPD